MLWFHLQSWQRDYHNHNEPLSRYKCQKADWIFQIKTIVVSHDTMNELCDIYTTYLAKRLHLNKSLPPTPISECIQVSPLLARNRVSHDRPTSLAWPHHLWHDFLVRASNRQAPCFGRLGARLETYRFYIHNISGIHSLHFFIPFVSSSTASRQDAGVLATLSSCAYRIFCTPDIAFVRRWAA